MWVSWLNFPKEIIKRVKWNLKKMFSIFNLMNMNFFFSLEILK